MKVKKRLILGRVFTLVLGIVCIALGVYRQSDQLINMGSALLFVGILQASRQWKIIKDPEKLKELEIVYNDERENFIARKSYSVAMWLSVYIEFAGIIVTSCLKMDNVATLLGMIVCMQMIIYVFASLFYRKRL